MRTLAWIAFVALPVLAHAGTDTVAVVGIQDGRPLVFTREAEERIAELARELLLTALVEAGPPIATERRWQEARRASHLHVSFTPARTAIFRFSTTGPAAEHEVQVDEMLIPISKDRWPDYILVRERGKMRAFSKYDPRQAEALQDALQ